MFARTALLGSLIGLWFSAHTSCMAAPPSLLELTVKDAPQRGKLLAMDDYACWLMSPAGRIDRYQLKHISGMKRLSAKFRPRRTIELREELRQEFGKEFEFATSDHYIVCAKPGSARGFAKLFESVYRTFHNYFSVRGFRVDKPEFPLVAIVFPDQTAFANYCRQDGFPAFRGLMGYYLRTSNRVALFDAQATGGESTDTSQRRRAAYRVGTVMNAGLQDTIIHEATHQVAFNVGLHSRIGDNPKWIVEGLATVFEAPGIRDSKSNSTLASRINRDRFVWFKNFAEKRRKPNSLESFLKVDIGFQTSALDAYSQAWALSFYLVETRPAAYAKYLKKVADRDPMESYTGKQRVADFQASFGGDLRLFEAGFLRYMDRLAP